ncbi:MAG: flagellar biosynthesis protein FlhA [Pseudomonadales bacterium]|nr:flagellar biosynthesis protein FlhA [Pseudomonadales bacterium]
MLDGPSLLKTIFKSGLGVPLFLLLILGMMTLPLPPFMLDVLFSFNIALSLVIILATIYALRPLDLAVFPTLLLVATLMRLALNIASTRVVLLHGHEGSQAAGRVIEAFGHVVIGGNYAVGVVVFTIFIIINFVVITKGAGRVSEVSARFTLDAMPGKQMAIDADLNAGLINQEEAKLRRSEVAQEADFYGSMDGASKFVRGDAVAGILILIINLLGGIIIGMLQHHMNFSDAVAAYALLTIGDGIVAQIPALLLSTASAILVTRVSSSQRMTDQLIAQLFRTPQPLFVAAGILTVMGIVPGMPHMAFWLLAIIAGGAGWMLWRQQQEARKVVASTAAAEVAPAAAAAAAESKEIGWEDVLPVDSLGLEVGYRLIPLVDRQQGGQLLSRIKGVRRKLSQELGFLLPSVHIRDNLELPPNTYRITLMGVNVSQAEAHVDKELAINPGQVFGPLRGIECKDPAFGLDAVWIEVSQRDHAQSLGYTVVDTATVVATHLNSVMQKHAWELLGHEEVQQLVNQLARTQSRLVESLMPSPVSLSLLLRILQNLLRENIPIRDLRSICESLADTAQRTQDVDTLTAHVRVALSRMIVQGVAGDQSEIAVITLEPELEQLLLQSVQQARSNGGTDSDAVLEPGLAERLRRSLSEAASRMEMTGKESVLLVSMGVRSMLARFARYSLPGLTVLAYNEIPDNRKVTIFATAGR